MQQAEINANSMMIFREWFSFHLASKHCIPSITLTLDGTGFDGSLDLSVHLYLDTTNLGETHTVISSEARAALGIGEAIVTIAALKPGIAWGLSTLPTCKESLECLLYPT